MKVSHNKEVGVLCRHKQNRMTKNCKLLFTNYYHNLLQSEIICIFITKKKIYI